MWLGEAWEEYSVRQRRWGRPEDRFVAALFVAGALHAVFILGVTFAKPKLPDRPSTTLDVVLVHAPSGEAPKDADFLAQANQLGGSETEQQAPPANPLPAPVRGPRAEVVSATIPRPATTVTKTRAAPKVLVQHNSADDRSERRPPRPRPRPGLLAERTADTPPLPPVKTNIKAVEVATNSLAHKSLNAEVARRLSEYAAKPRRKWVTARTRASKYAAYMDAWRVKVERIGNLNYPDAARRERLSGSLLLDVSVNANGSIHRVALRRSSGHRVLDDAAIRIVKLAAPFAPLPAAIRRETDILHIERTWQFHATDGLTAR